MSYVTIEASYCGKEVSWSASRSRDRQNWMFIAAWIEHFLIESSLCLKLFIELLSVILSLLLALMKLLRVVVIVGSLGERTEQALG